MPMEYRWHSIWLETASFSIPKLAAIAVSASKQLLVKCSLHKTELLLGPCQLARVLCTPLVHCFHNAGSRGNVYRLTPSLYVLEQPVATQRLTISNLYDVFILNLNSYNVAGSYIRVPLVTCNYA